MPIYQYKCTECGHQLESLQKMSAPPLSDCPVCNSPTLRKQLTAAAFKLKGTGWYATDFKNSGTKPDAKKTVDSSTSSTPDAGKTVESATKSTETAA